MEINVFDSEAIVKIYRMLNKKCEAIDRFIKNHALYFGATGPEFGAEDVYNNIIDLIQRKNQLINLKIIIDSAVARLSEKDKKILYIKMNYDLSIAEICGVLDLKERTAFRYIERAFEDLTLSLNASRYKEKLLSIINNEDWIISIRESVRDRRESFKLKSLSV